MRRILILLTSILVLVSCQQEEVRPDTPEGNFEALWQLVDERYCFLDYKAATIGLDWDEVHQRYALRISPKMTNAQLFEVLSDMLSELRDGHVNLYTSLDVGRNWSWREDYPKNFSKTLQDQYLGTGTDYRISGGMKYRILDDNIGYVAVGSFSSGIGDGNLDDVLYSMRLCKGLIVDVRNNSGGELTTAERMARRFTNERIHVGYMCHKTGKGHNDFSEPRAEYLEPSTRVRWQKPLVVLTNRGCYSATNTFVRDMKRCNGVTVVGDQTGGGSGLPMSSELPNGWSVRFSACPHLDINKQHIEFGIQPDVLCMLDAEDEAKGCDTLIELARKILRGEATE